MWNSVRAMPTSSRAIIGIGLANSPLCCLIFNSDSRVENSYSISVTLLSFHSEVRPCNQHGFTPTLSLLHHRRPARRQAHGRGQEHRQQ